MWTVSGKTALITGATRGIGLEAAVAFAAAGARPILIGRDPRRVEQAVARVRERTSVTAAAYVCDFSSLADVRRLAATICERHPRLELLVNNAGGVHKERTLTVDGFETTFATNHLSHFLLTTELLDVIVRSAPARIITVASIGHRRGTMDFGDLDYAHGYGIMRAYSRSKLANVLFSNELARRLEGTGVTSNSVHPGTVDTNIWSGAPAWAKPLIWLARVSFISAEAGAQTIVQLAVDPALQTASGQYFENKRAVKPSALAQDEALAARLWEASAQLVRPGV